MAETTKETKAQRAKKYRTRRLLVGAAGLVLCVGVAFGIDGVVTARADSALADALAAATAFSGRPAPLPVPCPAG